MTSTDVRTTAAPFCPVFLRRRLMVGCALAVLAAIVADPHRAAAQAANPGGAFQGSITSSTIDVHRNITSSTTETIVLGRPTATINWAPYDSEGPGSIDFLPQGHVVTFHNEPDVPDFTVLNRIVPTNSERAIELNGTVISQIRSGTGTTTGGHIWFYSPGGIIVGATAVFDVGGLLLTANDPGAGWSADSTGFSGTFTATAGSKAGVVVEPGAQIHATTNNSYVALIAPRIDQGGIIDVNGSAALVAGEQMTMTLDQGLFDIRVDIGTTHGEGINHSGTTGGAASSGADDHHRIYMVAVPKNQALTMALGGAIGFAPATSASVENGQIILSAGSNIDDSANGYIATQAGGASADMVIGAGHYSSDLSAIASGDLDVLARDGAIAFAGDVTVRSLAGIGDGDVTLTASSGNALSIGGDLLMITEGADITSSVLLVARSGASIDIAGSATLIAGASGDATVGSAAIHADNGFVSVGGLASLSADAASGAGSVALVASDGGTLDLDGGAALSATGSGGDGGSIEIIANRGVIAVDGELTADASGARGGAIAVSVRAGGSADLGSATLAALGANGSGSIALDLDGPRASLTAAELTLISSGAIGLSSNGGAGVTVAGTFSATAGGLIGLDDQSCGAVLAADHILLDGAQISSDWSFEAQTIALTADGDLDATGDLIADQTLAIKAGGDIVTGDLTAGDSVLLDADGHLTAGDIAAGGDASLTAGGDLRSGTIDADGGVALTAAGDVEAGDIAAGSAVTVAAGGDFFLAGISAPSTIDLTAGGTANFLGLVSAPTITVTSADIAIAAGASLGEAGVTSLLTLNAASDGAPVIIGGGGGGSALAASAGAQYRLDEAGDIFADTLIFNALGADIQLLDATFDGNAINHVELNTDSNVLIDGTARFVNAAGTDSLAINAGDSILVNTTSGGAVIMTGSDGALAGSLALTAANIWVADQALLAQLAADPAFAGRNAALKVNNGAVNSAGYLQSGEMFLAISRTLFLQNSGTATQFAGITVGAGGLSIQATGAAPATAVAFGQQIDLSGAFITGDEFFKQIRFGGLFTPDSEFNGCGVGGGCIRPVVGGVESILGPVGLMGDPDTRQGDIEELLISTRRLTDDELIEDPVTSGSDSGQWGKDADEDEEEDEDEDEEG